MKVQRWDGQEVNDGVKEIYLKHPKTGAILVTWPQTGTPVILLSQGVFESLKSFSRKAAGRIWEYQSVLQGDYSIKAHLAVVKMYGLKFTVMVVEVVPDEPY